MWGSSGHLKNTKISKYAENVERLMSLDFKREVALIVMHPIISNVNDDPSSVKQSKFYFLIIVFVNRDQKTY